MILKEKFVERILIDIRCLQEAIVVDIYFWFINGKPEV